MTELLAAAIVELLREVPIFDFSSLKKLKMFLDLFIQLIFLSTDESEDEEFFDCQTESKEYKDAFDFNIARVSLWNQPEGRLRKFNNLRLIETGDYMYIPITQVLILRKSIALLS